MQLLLFIESLEFGKDSAAFQARYSSNTAVEDKVGGVADFIARKWIYHCCPTQAVSIADLQRDLTEFYQSVYFNGGGGGGGSDDGKVQFYALQTMDGFDLPPTISLLSLLENSSAVEKKFDRLRLLLVRGISADEPRSITTTTRGIAKGSSIAEHGQQQRCKSTIKAFPTPSQSPAAASTSGRMDWSSTPASFPSTSASRTTSIHRKVSDQDIVVVGDDDDDDDYYPPVFERPPPPVVEEKSSPTGDGKSPAPPLATAGEYDVDGSNSSSDIDSGSFSTSPSPSNGGVMSISTAETQAALASPIITTVSKTEKNITDISNESSSDSSDDDSDSSSDDSSSSDNDDSSSDEDNNSSDEDDSSFSDSESSAGKVQATKQPTILVNQQSAEKDAENQFQASTMAKPESSDKVALDDASSSSISNSNNDSDSGSDSSDSSSSGGDSSDGSSSESASSEEEPDGDNPPPSISSSLQMAGIPSLAEITVQPSPVLAVQPLPVSFSVSNMSGDDDVSSSSSLSSVSSSSSDEEDNGDDENSQPVFANNNGGNRKRRKRKSGISALASQTKRPRLSLPTNITSLRSAASATEQRRSSLATVSITARKPAASKTHLQPPAQRQPSKIPRKLLQQTAIAVAPKANGQAVKSADEILGIMMNDEHW